MPYTCGMKYFIPSSKLAVGTSRPHLLSVIFLTLIIVLGAFASRLDAADQPPKKPLNIVTTTSMVADQVRNIGGDRVQVTSLMGEGIDPHLYKPTRDDVAKLQKADMILYNGLMLEGRMTDVFTRLRKGGKPVLAVGETLDPATLLQSQNNSHHPDPHVWMDVKAWSKISEAVEKFLITHDPEGKKTYEMNARDFRTQLTGLDQYIQKVIHSIPEPQRVLLTAHDAFRYYGRTYKIDVKGVQGISTESEAGVQDINNLVDFIVKNKIGAVFVESTVPDKNLAALIEGAHSRGQKVVIGGSLYSDAMGPAQSYEGTYIGMLDHNSTLIARSLGGKAPAGGMQGKLGNPTAPEKKKVK